MRFYRRRTRLYAALRSPRCTRSLSLAMRLRRLGSSNLEVTVVGLGCNNFGGRIDEDATRAVIDAALDAGVTFFDTADVYGNNGGSEELSAGRWRPARPGRARDEVRPRHGRRRDARAARAPTSAGGRGFAAAAADRLDRPLPVPPARRRHADRGDARRARRAGRRRATVRDDRLLELHRADGRGGATRRRRARADAVRLRAEPVLVARAATPRTSCCRPASGSASASSRSSRWRAAC